MSLVTIENVHQHFHTDSRETERLLNLIFERIKTMPTVQEVKDAVSAAVIAEREQYTAAVKKAVEEAVANTQTNISEEDKNFILTAIDSIAPPPAQ